MRFRVPQFIETEEKVIGPFTLKQFLWVGGGGALIFIIFQFNVGNFFLYLLSLPIIVIAGMMAFYKVDGMPLPTYIYRAITFMTGPKKYFFKKKVEEAYLENLNNSASPKN